jgi:parallel beta-helix repeat protein
VNGQNGIVIGAGTSATITDNTISGNQFAGAYSGPNPITAVQAVGIQNLGSSSISGNTVTGNDLGIYNRSTGTTISGNTVQDSFEGIFLDEGNTTVCNNTVDGNNIGVAVVAFVGSTANSQGALLSNNIFNNGNGGLSFPGAGISVLAEAGATTTTLASANFNRIVGNSVGVDSTTTTPADATLNWWGATAGRTRRATTHGRRREHQPLASAEPLGVSHLDRAGGDRLGDGQRDQ